MSPASGSRLASAVPIPSRNTTDNRSTPAAASSIGLGTSPSAALTSHLTLFGEQQQQQQQQKTPLVPAASSSEAASEDSPYLVMSPVDPDKHRVEDFKTKATPPIKYRTASIDSTGGARPKTTRGRYSRTNQSDSQRNSLCLDDHHHWDFNSVPQDNPGAGGVVTNLVPTNDITDDMDYVPLEFGPDSRVPSTTSSSHTLSKIDSTSSTTPAPIPTFSRLRLNDDDLEEPEDNFDTPALGIKPSVHSALACRAFSVGCRPPTGTTTTTGSNSSVSTTGSGSGHPRHKSRFIDIPGAASGTSGTGTGSHSSSISPGGALYAAGAQAGQSPSTMASRIGSWIRHRTGSVPSKSALNGRRRHRTQSEGEKEDGGV
jgi:hypothetical protein